MDKLTLQNPVFATYVVAATLMILKGVAMSWLTVARMLQVNGGFRSPEDVRKTPFNPKPSPAQLAPNDFVDRIRRIQLNDLESLPYFLVAGLLYVLTDPSLWLARLLLYGFVLSRLAHFVAYFTAQTHDTRAMFWSVGSLILIVMTVRTLVAALAADARASPRLTSRPGWRSERRCFGSRAAGPPGRRRRGRSRTRTPTRSPCRAA